MAACVQQEVPVADTVGTTPAGAGSAADEARDAAVRDLNRLISACDAAAVQRRVGARLDRALQRALLEESGAADLRVVRPGQPVSRDLRTDRLTVEVDGQDVITRLSCG